MNCEFKTAKQVYDLFKFISQFENEVVLDCKPEGISMFTMSNCHSVFIDVNLPVPYFSSFQCEAPTSIGLNLTVLLNALSGCNPKDTLKMIKKSDDQLTFTRISEDESIEYQIRPMNIEQENLDIPEMEENVCIKIVPSYLKKWKKNMIDFTKSTLEIKPREKSLVLSSKGDGGSVTSTQSMPSFGIEYEVNKGAEPVQLGNKNVTKAFTIGDISKDIEMGWANGMPFRMSAFMGDGGTLRVFMAPCLNEDMVED